MHCNPEPAQADTGAAGPAALEAERLVRAGSFTQAETALASVSCDELQPCTVLNDFSYGWLYEEWAAATENDPARLQRAQDYYASALQRSPDNVQILGNYLHVARGQGDYGRAVTAVERLIELQPDQAYRHQVLRGDLLLCRAALITQATRISLPLNLNRKTNSRSGD